jgi:tetratricopeptide (TPR) repeat protein
MQYADRGEKLERALELALSAKQQLPDRADIDDTLGWVYYKRNMNDLAIVSFEQSIQREPNRPEFHFHLGLALAKAGRNDDARRALEQALKLRPDFAGASEARSALAGLKG